MYIVYGILLYFKPIRPEHGDMIFESSSVFKRYHAASDTERVTITDVPDFTEDRTEFVNDMKTLVTSATVTDMMRMLEQYDARPLNRDVYNALRELRSYSKRASYIIQVFRDPSPGKRDVRRIVDNVWANMYKIYDNSSVVNLIVDYTNWNLSKSVELKNGHTTRVVAMLELTDRRLVTSDCEVIKVWDTSTGDCTELKNDRVRNVGKLCLLSEGDIIVHGTVDGNESLVTWDIARAEYLHFACNGSLLDMVASPSEPRVVYYTTESGLYKLNVIDRSCVMLSYGMHSRVICLHNGHIASIRHGRRTTVQIYDALTRKFELDLGPSCGPRLCALSELQDGCVACVIPTTRVRGEYVTQIWDIKTGEEKQRMLSQSRIANFPTSSRISQLADGKLVTFTNGMVSIWTLDDNNIYYKLAKTFRTHRNQRYVMDIESSMTKTHGGEIITAMHKTDHHDVPDDKLLRVWNPDSGECVVRADVDGQYTSCVLILSNGQLATGSKRGVVRLWGG